MFIKDDFKLFNVNFLETLKRFSEAWLFLDGWGVVQVQHYTNNWSFIRSCTTYYIAARWRPGACVMYSVSGKTWHNSKAN